MPQTVVVSDLAGIPDIVAAVQAAGGRVGLDCETTGLDPKTDRVRLIQFATPAAVYVIDLFRITERGDFIDVFAALGGVEVIGHNLQFDLRFLRRLGFSPGLVYDTMLASQVLHAGRDGEKGNAPSHKLAEVVRRELCQSIEKGEQTSDWSGDLTRAQMDYAARDAAVLLPLAATLRSKIDTAGLTPTAALEMRALPGIAWATGVLVDDDAWTEQTERCRAECESLLGELASLDPTPRNWNSPAQVKQAFGAVGIAITSTGDEVLAGIAHPLAIALRKYRSATKRLSTYGANWLAKHVRPDGAFIPVGVRSAPRQVG